MISSAFLFNISAILSFDFVTLPVKPPSAASSRPDVALTPFPLTLLIALPPSLKRPLARRAVPAPLNASTVAVPLELLTAFLDTTSDLPTVSLLSVFDHSDSVCIPCFRKAFCVPCPKPETPPIIASAATPPATGIQLIAP